MDGCWDTKKKESFSNLSVASKRKREEQSRVPDWWPSERSWRDSLRETAPRRASATATATQRVSLPEACWPCSGWWSSAAAMLDSWTRARTKAKASSRSSLTNHGGCWTTSFPFLPTTWCFVKPFLFVVTTLQELRRSSESEHNIDTGLKRTIKPELP